MIMGLNYPCEVFRRLYLDFNQDDILITVGSANHICAMNSICLIFVRFSSAKGDHSCE